MHDKAARTGPHSASMRRPLQPRHPPAHALLAAMRPSRALQNAQLPPERRTQARFRLNKDVVRQLQLQRQQAGMKVNKVHKAAHSVKRKPQERADSSRGRTCEQAGAGGDAIDVQTGGSTQVQDSGGNAKGGASKAAAAASSASAWVAAAADALAPQESAPDRSDASSPHCMLSALASVQVHEVDSSNAEQVLAAFLQLLPGAASGEAPHAVALAAADALAKHAALRDAAHQQHSGTLAALVTRAAQSSTTFASDACIRRVACAQVHLGVEQSFFWQQALESSALAAQPAGAVCQAVRAYASLCTSSHAAQVGEAAWDADPVVVQALAAAFAQKGRDMGAEDLGLAALALAQLCSGRHERAVSPQGGATLLDAMSAALSGAWPRDAARMLRSCKALSLQPDRAFLQAAARVVCGEALASEAMHVYAGCKALLELDVPADAALCAATRWSAELVARDCTARKLADVLTSLARHRLRPNAALRDALFNTLAAEAGELSQREVGMVCMALGTLQLVPPHAAAQALAKHARSIASQLTASRCVLPPPFVSVCRVREALCPAGASS